MAFNVTRVAASIPSTVTQAMHSDVENKDADEVMFSCWEWWSICEKK